MFKRNEHVTLRKEIFGGMAFHTKTGTTIELDKEGHFLLETLGRPKGIEDLARGMLKEFQRKSSGSEIKKFVMDLTEIGFVSEGTKEGGYGKNLAPIVQKRDNVAKNINCLSAPETVHLTLTHKCNLSCPLCYEIKKDTPEMPKDAIFTLIDTLAKMRVFQLAIGGGEPFLREDIFEIIEYCRKKGIVPNITTNGTLIDYPIIKRIKHKVGGVSVSLNGHSSEANIGRDPNSFNNAVQGIKHLLSGGIPTGINVLVSSGSLTYLEDTLNFMRGLGVKWINILRFKPGQGNEHLIKYILTKEELRCLKGVLDRWNGLLDINVDTALTCLMHSVPIQLLREKAVYGCVAGIRFCTIDCNGDVYPCSFFKGSKYIAGNVLNDDFEELWQNSNVFEKFRGMRKRLKGKCKDCRIKEYCGGCRSIVLESNKDFYGEDVACIKDFGG